MKTSLQFWHKNDEAISTEFLFTNNAIDFYHLKVPRVLHSK